MTLQQAAHYLTQLAEYRKTIDPLDIAVAYIKKALWSYLGVKEQPDISEQIQKSPMPSMSVPAGAVEAWEKAGRPEPNKFFAEYAKKKKAEENG